VDAEGLSIALGAEQSVLLAASVPLTKEPGGERSRRARSSWRSEAASKQV
jgi:hypothetical protein